MSKIGRPSRVLVKLSGEALMGESAGGVDQPTINAFARDLVSLAGEGVSVGVVVGGGNIFRGLSGTATGMDRATADHMGMLATVMNGLALGGALSQVGGRPLVMSAIPMDQVCATYTIRDARMALDNGQIVVAAGGTGNPFFTTDTAATLRAVEMQCDAMMKATQVDGVYSADPKTDPSATRYETVSYDDVLRLGLKVMDAAAIALARDNNLPVSVFKLDADGTSIRDAWRGNRKQTLVSA
jgi:uridylate kinase